MTAGNGTSSKPVLVWDLQATLGEGPVWSVRDQALWFVDIKRPAVLRLGEDVSGWKSWIAPEEVGFVVPASDGGLVAGLRSGLHRFDPGDGSFSPLVAVDRDRAGNRLNDAATSPSGDLWFGTMDNAGAAATGRLYRYGAGGLVDADIPDTAIVNGPAFSPDGRWLYWVDTLAGTVFRASVSHGGEVGQSEPWLVIPAADGYPDGPTVDSEGCVWIGLYAGWAARRHAPDGRLLATVEFPVANVTKLAFGGPDLRTVYATTARQALVPEELARQPLAGGVFAFRTEVPGLPCRPAMV